MNEPDAFERILASLYDAMLDDTRWPATSALLDEACGLTGNALLVGEGPKDDIRVLFVGLYHRGQRRTRSGAGVPRSLLSHRRTHTALSETARQSIWCPSKSLYTVRGVEDLACLQRRIPPGQVPEWLERASWTSRMAPTSPWVSR